jgi:hypothetical protein
MLINICLFVGSDHTQATEGRVLLNALDNYREEPAISLEELKAVASLQSAIIAGFLDVTAELDPCQEPDGRGGYRDVYKSAKTTVRP